MCVSGVLRFVLGTITFIFLMFGVALVAMGFLIKEGAIYLLKHIKPLLGALGNNGQDVDFNGIFYAISMVFIVLGVFIMVLTAIGFIGTACKIKILIVLYGVIVLLILLVQIGAVIAVGAKKALIREMLTKRLGKVIEKDFKGISSTSAISGSITFTFIFFGCCGVYNATDMLQAKHWKREYKIGNLSLELKTPLACCKDVIGTFPNFKIPKISDLDNIAKNFKIPGGLPDIKIPDGGIPKIPDNIPNIPNLPVKREAPDIIVIPAAIVQDPRTKRNAPKQVEIPTTPYNLPVKPQSKNIHNDFPAKNQGIKPLTQASVSIIPAKSSGVANIPAKSAQVENIPAKSTQVVNIPAKSAHVDNIPAESAQIYIPPKSVRTINIPAKSAQIHIPPKSVRTIHIPAKTIIDNPHEKPSDPENMPILPVPFPAAISEEGQSPEEIAHSKLPMFDGAQVCAVNPTEENNNYKTGCLVKLEDYLNAKANMLIGFGVGVAFVEFACIMCSFVLCHLWKKEGRIV